MNFKFKKKCQNINPKVNVPIRRVLSALDSFTLFIHMMNIELKEREN